MKKRLSFLALLLAVTLLAGCAAQTTAPPDTAAQAQPSAEPQRTSGVGFYFDTVVTLTLYNAPEGMLDEIWSACERYENLLSKTIETSDVSRINRANGQTVTVDPETWEILRRAKEISAMTGGAFSVTIAPLSAMWDFTGGTQRMPTDEERLAALPLVDDSRIDLGEGSTVTLPAGMEIDLGGIAKGYIADKVAEMIRGRVSAATLNFGGNVYAVGQLAEGRPFGIGIQDPAVQESAAIAAVYVKDASVVTSGIYQRFFEKDGVVYHHILDPKTGLSADSDLSGVSIVDESSMTADALATACIVLGREKATELLNQNGFCGLLITRDRQVYTTSDLTERYALRTIEGIAIH